MDDLARKLADAGARLDPGWDQERAEEALGRARGRIRRRRLLRRGAAAAALAGAAVTLLLWLGIGGGEQRQAVRGDVARGAPNAGGVAPADDQPTPIRLADGSTATPVDGEAEIVAERVSSSAVTMRLERGAARFDVAPDPNRRFRVEAGPVAVEVLGTDFSVARRHSRVEVEVHRGRVRVEWQGGRQDVWAGGRGLFPPSVEPEAPETPAELAPGPAEDPEPPPDAEQAHGSRWRVLAEAGRFDEAWEALSRSAVRGDVAELLLAADVARHEGHSADAAGYLRRAVQEHPADPRAPLAAFTLGRVLLGQGGRSAEAAEAFARARALAPGGSLAEDALAREVEAWSRAGRRDRARERASTYLERYPRGLRAESVRRHAGLD